MQKKWLRLGRKGDPLGIAQETDIWPYYQMERAEIKIRPEEGNIKFSEIFK